MNYIKNQILQNNAIEARARAIRYCDYILEGKATLEYRKHFVSVLHNSVELFVKQLMLKAIVLLMRLWNLQEKSVISHRLKWWNVMENGRDPYIVKTLIMRLLLLRLGSDNLRREKMYHWELS